MTQSSDDNLAPSNWLDADFETAFSTLYDSIGERVYQHALPLLCSPEDAEDLVHDVFVKIMNNRQAAAKAKNLEAYVFAMSRNMTYDKLRKRGEPRSIHVLEPFLEAKRDHDVPPDEARLLSEALDALPLEQKEAIVMKIYHNMTFDQIAAVISRKRDTVVSRYRYGLEKIRNSLEELK